MCCQEIQALLERDHRWLHLTRDPKETEDAPDADAALSPSKVPAGLSTPLVKSQYLSNGAIVK